MTSSWYAWLSETSCIAYHLAWSIMHGSLVRRAISAKACCCCRIFKLPTVGTIYHKTILSLVIVKDFCLSCYFVRNYNDIQKLCFMFFFFRGLYITINDIGHVFEILCNWPEQQVKVYILTLILLLISSSYCLQAIKFVFNKDFLKKWVLYL